MAEQHVEESTSEASKDQSAAVPLPPVEPAPVQPPPDQAATELPAVPVTILSPASDTTDDRCGPNVLAALGAPINYQEPQENYERGNWSNQFEFLLACVGYAIGLGNIWRFPYIVYEYGGGSFLLAYWLIFFVVAFPAFFIELALGQFSSSGPVAIFRSLVPAFEGLGGAALIVQAGTSVYYNALFAVALFYAFASLKMDWKHCHSEWNSKACFSIEQYDGCVKDKPYDRWWLKGECYDEANLTQFYRNFDHYCVHNADMYKDDNQPRCQIQLDFCFKDDFTPTALLGVKLEKSIFQHDVCVEWVDVPLELVDKARMDEPQKFVIRMSADGQGEKTAKIMKKHGLTLERLMEDYCRQWNAGKASGCQEDDGPKGKKKGAIACAREVIRPREAYSSQEYYSTHIFRSDASFTDFKGYYWPVPLALALSCVLVGLGVLQGPKWMGKVVYVTSILPFVTIIILIIYVTTLPGHSIGVKWYMRTEWCKLADPKLWLVATAQIFFSLSIGSGGLMTLASYNRFHQDVLRNAFIIALSNCIFSLITGFGIFGAVGFMAHKANTEVSEVLRGSGGALAFVALAQTVATMPGSNFWGVLFFITLAALAIDSVFAMIETIIAFTYDTYPVLRNYRVEVVSITCVILFLGGLPFVSKGGNLLSHVLDEGLYNWMVPLTAAFQLVMVASIYGANTFAKDIDMMLGGTTGNLKRFGSVLWKNVVFREYILMMWMVPAPLCIIGMMIATIATSHYDLNTVPGVFTVLFALVVPVLCGSALTYRMYQGKTCAELLKPTDEWGPALNVNRALDTERYPPKAKQPKPTDLRDKLI